jgi:hypothetical protein
VFGNVGSIISFRLGGDDALKLKSEFAPIFDTKDLINLGVGEFYIKMTIDGESYDPFSAETLKVLPPTHQTFRKQIIDASRRKFAGRVEDVKAAILEEESSIVRSAQEKAAISHTGKTDETETDVNNEPTDTHPQSQPEQPKPAKKNEGSPLI